MNLKRILFALPLCLLALVSTSSLAQMSANPPEVGAKIRAMGPHLTPEIIGTTNKLYGPLQAAAPKDGVNVVKDVKYGPDERNVMDVYEPDKKPAGPMPDPGVPPRRGVRPRGQGRRSEHRHLLCAAAACWR